MALIPASDHIQLEWPPDCIEFVPNSQDTFVLGTYYLEEDAKLDDGGQSRQGSLLLCRLQGDSIAVEDRITTDGGAYDLHFKNSAALGENVVGVSTSTGLISIYGIDESITFKGHFRLAEQNVLLTSFAWHPRQPDLVAAALSTGEVVVAMLQSNDAVRSQSSVFGKNTLAKLNEISRHSEAAWQVAWTSNGTTLLHGGDDMKLGWQSFAPEHVHFIDDTSRGHVSSGRDIRIHGAGVTAILPLNDEWILTGSYDEYIRLVHIANNRATAETSLKFDDGVFRLRFLHDAHDPIPNQPYRALILASCMRAGTRIIELKGLLSDSGDHDWTLRVVAAFAENGSLNYAAACSADAIVSLSFYDKKAFLWRWSDSEERR